MPNHIHVLIKTNENHSVSKIVWGWKTWISKFVNKRPEYYARFLKYYTELIQFEGFGTAPRQRKVHLKPAKSCGVPGSTKPAKPCGSLRQAQSIWCREYWDRFIRDENQFYFSNQLYP